MVGQKPPLPRSYPVFRFATALATLLFAISFVTNQVGQLAASAPMSPYGIGGGDGSDVATEAPALSMAPMATEAPVATEPPVVAESAPTQMALVVPTATPEPSADRVWAEGPGFPKANGETIPASPRPLLTPLQMTFGLLALLGAASMFLIQKLAARKWRAK